MPALDPFFSHMLEYYRAPLAHPGFVDASQPVPDQLSLLLDALAGSGNKLLYFAGSLGVGSEEYREAALFYIKQLLFASSADYYRVLGVNHDATLDTIRKHYRALIGLFHPDRNPEADAWDRMYAPRLNEAYNVLKKPQQRDEYDRQLKMSAMQGDAWHIVQHPVPRPAPASKRSQTRVYAESPIGILNGSWLWQRFPKLVVVSGLLIFMLLFFALSHRSSDVVELQQKIAPTIEQGNGAQKSAVEQERAALLSILQNNQLTETSENDSVVSAPAPRSETTGTEQDKDFIANTSLPVAEKPVPMKWPTREPGTSNMLEKPAELTEKPTESIELQMGRYEEPLQERIEDRGVTGVEHSEKSKLPDKKGVTRTPLAAPVTRADKNSVQTTGRAVEKLGLSKDDQSELDVILVRYLMAYEIGDMERMAAFFDTSHRTKAAWKTRLQAQHDALFSSTSSRRLKVLDTRWLFEPAGEARAQLDVHMVATDDPRRTRVKYQGALVLAFVDTEFGPRLSKVTDHLQPEKKEPFRVSAQASSSESVIEILPDKPAQVIVPDVKQQPICPQKPDEASNVMDEPPLDQAKAAGEHDIQPEQLVLRYVNLYQSGDLLGMVGLFTLDAVIDGKQGIKYVAQNYDRLFSGTSDRTMRLTGIQAFRNSPSSAQLHILANIIHKRVEGGEPLRYKGEIEMEIIQRSERLYISRLTQKINQE